jgi:hypothetical protein
MGGGGSAAAGRHASQGAPVKRGCGRGRPPSLPQLHQLFVQPIFAAVITWNSTALRAQETGGGQRGQRGAAAIWPTSSHAPPLCDRPLPVASLSGSIMRTTATPCPLRAPPPQKKYTYTHTQTQIHAHTLTPAAHAQRSTHLWIGRQQRQQRGGVGAQRPQHALPLPHRRHQVVRQEAQVGGVGVGVAARVAPRVPASRVPGPPGRRHSRAQQAGRQGSRSAAAGSLASAAARGRAARARSRWGGCGKRGAGALADRGAGERDGPGTLQGRLAGWRPQQFGNVDVGCWPAHLCSATSSSAASRRGQPAAARRAAAPAAPSAVNSLQRRCSRAAR